MTEFIAALLLVVSVERGYAAYYADGMMQDVVTVRQAGWTAGPLPAKIPDGVVGFVARPDCGEIGGMLWLFHESEGWRGPYLVSDCANHVRGHHLEMKRHGIVVEVDYATAVRWGVIGKGPLDIPVTVVRFRRPSFGGPP